MSLRRQVILEMIKDADDEKSMICNVLSSCKSSDNKQLINLAIVFQGYYSNEMIENYDQ